MCNYLNWNLKKYYLCNIIILIERDMKTMRLWMMAAILFCGAGCLVSCNGNAGTDNVATDNAVSEDSVDAVEMMNHFPFLPALNQYLVDSIGSQYAPGEVCIPCATIVACDQAESDSAMKVWGDFWVFNFNVAGDTLKTVSGGDHPGLMRVKQNDKGEYEILSFEQVEDGHGNEASARRIFGDMYEAFHGINSDEETREEARSVAIGWYVKTHNLPVKYYQDYGWPAREIPVKHMVPSN